MLTTMMTCNSVSFSWSTMIFAVVLITLSKHF
jgi:hypothetical protein